MRIIAIWLFFLAASVFAFKDWFRAALVLIVTMAIIERPDMPKQVLGIPGLNPWNLLLFATTASYFINSRKNPSAPGLTPLLGFLASFYVIVVFVSFVREVSDLSGMDEFNRMFGRPSISASDVFKDHLLNTFKYVLPAYFVYRGCNSPQRTKEVIWSVVAMNGILAVLVIKSMGFDALTGGELMEETAIRRIDRDVGYYRSDLAILLSGGVWGIYAFAVSHKSFFLKYGLIGLSGLGVLAIGLSGGRAGMGILAVLGLLFGLTRWRWMLIVAPLAGLLLFATIPAIQERLLQGFGQGESAQEEVEGEVDMTTVTSGRTEIWPYVIAAIADDPLVGHGRSAMQRSGLGIDVFEETGQVFPHPHNAYLQLFYDVGWIQAVPVLLFYLLVVRIALKLGRTGGETGSLVGTFALAYVLSFLMGAIAQQSFYPFAGSVSMWVAMAVLFRVAFDHNLLSADSPYNEQATMSNHRAGAVVSWSRDRVTAAFRKSKPKQAGQLESTTSTNS